MHVWWYKVRNKHLVLFYETYGPKQLLTLIENQVILGWSWKVLSNPWSVGFIFIVFTSFSAVWGQVGKISKKANMLKDICKRKLPHLGNQDATRWTKQFLRYLRSFLAMQPMEDVVHIVQLFIAVVFVIRVALVRLIVLISKVEWIFFILAKQLNLMQCQKIIF